MARSPLAWNAICQPRGRLCQDGVELFAGVVHAGRRWFTAGSIPAVRVARCRGRGNEMAMLPPTEIRRSRA